MAATLKNRDVTVSHEGADGKRADMPDASIQVLETKISNMGDDIAHIRRAVDELSKNFARVGVMEERSRSDREAIDRAFKEIKRLDDEVDAIEQRRQADRDHANRWFYGFCGAALVISALWALFGIAVRFL